MRAAVLAATLLALLRSMAWTAECQDTKRVKVTAESGFWKSKKQEGFDNYLATSVIYEIKYYCSGSQAKNLALVNEQDSIQNQGNSTTIWITSKPQPIGTYFLNCTDKITGCKDSVTVEVFPAITAVSQHSRVNVSVHAIFVPFGEFYEVLCTGTQAESLTISLNKQDIETVILNKTTVKSMKLHESENTRNYFSCRHTSTVKKPYLSQAIVYVDYPPAAADFSCIEQNKVITCTWKIMSIDIIYKLMVEGHGTLTTVCIGTNIGDFSKESNCDLFQMYPNFNEFVLLLEVCNIFFCNEQRFFINRKYIKKPSPPFLLKRLNTSAHSALVEFHVNTLDDYKDSALQFKVKYKQPGMILHTLNASSLRVSGSFYNVRILRCEMEMTFPCPSAFYKVKIYFKPFKNVYWSDPAIIHLYTNSGSTGSVNAVCNQKYEPITNKERGMKIYN